MTEQPHFAYSPLEGDDAIRLLIIEPGQPQSAINCRLINTSLSECHDDIFKHYTALSYVWGDATQKQAIFVNDHIFEVKHSLFDALHDLRDCAQPLRLWADAVCIDQLNLDERSLQVGIMKQIYSFAAFTVIYLGKSNEDVDKALAALRRGRCRPEHRDVIETQILTRPWFDRVWVYQELILSRVPLVRCGRSQESAPERHLANFIGNIDNRRACKASDLRDLIFGHLAIIGEIKLPLSSRFLAVDYRKSVIDVFTGAAEYIFDASDYEFPGERGKLLCHAGSQYPNLRMMKGLPTWVPDWSQPLSVSIMPPLSQISLDYSKYEPAMSMCNACLPPIKSTRRAIRLGLMPFGEVRQVGDVLHASTLKNDVQVQRIFEDFSHFIREDRVYDESQLLQMKEYVTNATSFDSPGVSAPRYRRSTSYLISELELAKLLPGRAIATLDDPNGSCFVVPADTKSGDSIYGLPEQSTFPAGAGNRFDWNFFVLRQLPLEGQPPSDQHLNSSDRDQPANEGHFTLVGQAMIPARLFKKKFMEISQRRQGTTLDKV